MQRERKEGVDFLRSRGNQAGGSFPAAAVQICCICFAESGGESRCVEFADGRSQFASVSVKCAGVDGSAEG